MTFDIVNYLPPPLRFLHYIPLIRIEMTILPINFYQTYTSQVRGLIYNLVISFHFFFSSHYAIFLLLPCVSTFSSLAFKSPINTIIIISSSSSLVCQINTSSPSTSFFFLCFKETINSLAVQINLNLE